MIFCLYESDGCVFPKSKVQYIFNRDVHTRNVLFKILPEKKGILLCQKSKTETKSQVVCGSKLSFKFYGKPKSNASDFTLFLAKK
jgi:hypothetical protein